MQNINSNRTETKERTVTKTLSLNSEDPFSKLFIQPEEIKKLIANKLAEAFKRKNREISERTFVEEKKKDQKDQKATDQQTLQIQNMQVSSGTKKSKETDASDSDDDRIDCSAGGYHWQTEAYWKLPENVRHAIDVAELKSKNTKFWRKLDTLNDKIYVYRSVFYSKQPCFQKKFQEKKEQEKENLSLNEKQSSKNTFKKENRSMLKKNKANSSQTVDMAYKNDVKDFCEVQLQAQKGITTQQMIENIKKMQKNPRLLISQSIPRFYEKRSSISMSSQTSSKNQKDFKVTKKLVSKKESATSFNSIGKSVNSDIDLKRELINELNLSENAFKTKKYKGKRKAMIGAYKVDITQINFDSSVNIQEASEKDEIMTPLQQWNNERRQKGLNIRGKNRPNL